VPVALCHLSTRADPFRHSTRVATPAIRSRLGAGDLSSSHPPPRFLEGARARDRSFSDRPGPGGDRPASRRVENPAAWARGRLDSRNPGSLSAENHSGSRNHSPLSVPAGMPRRLRGIVKPGRTQGDLRFFKGRRCFFA
jgi:hypothetical protein